MLRSSMQRGWIVWLAVVALGLLVGAPTVSRTLAAWSPVPALGADCAEHGSNGHHPAAPDDPSSLDHCGYCVLMCLSPALTGSVTLLLPSMPSVLPSAPRLAESVPALRSLDARSRGPPLS